jgi:HEAT repeats
LESLTDSNNAVQLAFWTGFFFTAISLLLMIFMVWIRGKGKLAKKGKNIVLLEWEDKFYEAVDSDFLKNAPRKASQKSRRTAKSFSIQTFTEDKIQNTALILPRKNLSDLLFLWNYLHESLRGKAKVNLNKFAYEHGIEHLTLELLRSKSLDTKLLAINTFGNLADENNFDEIAKLLFDADPILSFWAFRALSRINPRRILESHLQMIAHRTDWSPIFVAKLLKEIESDDLSEPLVELVRENYENNLEERQMSRLISYLVLTHKSFHTQIVNKILSESNETEVIIACLRLVCDEEKLFRVRELLEDERWQIRMHAVLTLGRFGKDEDVKNLLYMLNDLDWWVRYRSAGTLFRMPSMTVEKVTEYAETLTNQFSRDILQQVLAEDKFQCSIKPRSNGLSR